MNNEILFVFKCLTQFKTIFKSNNWKSKYRNGHDAADLIDKGI